MDEYQQLIASTLEEIQAALNQVDTTHCEGMIQAVMQAEHVFTAGKGRSGLQMQAFAMRLMHLGIKVYVVGDTNTPGIKSGDLLLIGSGSGKTASLVEYAKQAKALGANLGLITANTRSEIASMADHLIKIPAPTPKSGSSSRGTSIQPLGSLFEQSLGILLDVLILQLMSVKNIDAKQMFARHANLE